MGVGGYVVRGEKKKKGGGLVGRWIVDMLVGSGGLGLGGWDGGMMVSVLIVF